MTRPRHLHRKGMAYHALTRYARRFAPPFLAIAGLMVATGATGALAATADSAFTPKVLNKADLTSTIVGSTVHYPSADDDVYEYYAPDGRVLGISSKGGRYSANWKIRDDGTFCVINSDPKASGCAFVVVQPGKITYFRYDLVTEGPFDLLPGNPKQL